jgi:hypothetical protein
MARGRRVINDSFQPQPILTLFDLRHNFRAMPNQKRNVTRPRHVSVYATGALAQRNFAAGMGAVLRSTAAPKVAAPKRPLRQSAH